ncbi:MAG: hypothetical protein AB7F99_08435, partial [Vicinamibacterales bacterium]
KPASARAQETDRQQATGQEPAGTGGRATSDSAGDRSSRTSGERPVVAPGIPQFFAPSAADNASWRPFIYAAATVRFVDRKNKVDASRVVTRIASIGDGMVPVDWSASAPTDLMPDALISQAPTEGHYEPLPPAAAKAASYAGWTRQWKSWLGTNMTLELWRSPSTGLVSEPGESERDFRSRLNQSAREARDQRLDALRRKYAPKQAALEDKFLRARQAVARESEQASSEKMQTAISFGATVFGALLGRRIGTGTVGRATTAVRGAGRAMKASRDVDRARETLEAVEEDQRRLEDRFREETAELERATDASTETLERLVVQPRRSDVQTTVLALVWCP